MPRIGAGQLHSSRARGNCDGPQAILVSTSLFTAGCALDLHFPSTEAQLSCDMSADFGKSTEL